MPVQVTYTLVDASGAPMRDVQVTFTLGGMVSGVFAPQQGRTASGQVVWPVTGKTDLTGTVTVSLFRQSEITAPANTVFRVQVPRQSDQFAIVSDAAGPLDLAQLLVSSPATLDPLAPPATVTVGATTTGAPGSAASVNNSGTPSAAVLSFTIPAGAPGATGPAMLLGAPVATSAALPATGVAGEAHLAEDTGDIWSWDVATSQWVNGGPIRGAAGTAATVAVGTTATLAVGAPATVNNSGTASAAVLNFGLPQGAPGPANSLAIGTVTTGAAGSAASATIDGAAPSQTLNLTIPQGQTGTGTPGTAATVSVGTVTTLAAGSSATVVNGGTTSAAVLNFGLPQGSDGSPTAFELRGTGSPYGTVTPASAGIYYTDTAGTTGAWRWLSTGTTNTSWIVVVGDTGLRSMTTIFGGSFTSSLHLQRSGNLVTMALIIQGDTTGMTSYTIPAGFKRASAYDFERAMLRGGTTAVVGYMRISSGYLLSLNDTPNPTNGTGAETWITRDPWPTTLPGTAA